MDDILSDFQGITMLSKARWDKEGDDGVERRPDGTGPWRYHERQLGSFVRYERVDNHWRVTPEFPELELRWVPEASTRLAMLLTNEAHLADIPRDLEGPATAKGMKRVNTTLQKIETVVWEGFSTLPQRSR